MSDLQSELEADLATINRYWPALLDLPRAPSGDKVDTSNTSPTPIAISVLSLRFDAAQQLAAWAHLVWDERKLTSRLDLMDTPAICQFLGIHAGWLAKHRAGRDAGEEIGAIAGSIEELVEQTKAARYVVGKCPDCEGKLIVHMQSAGAPLPSDLRCSLNPEHVWDQTRWRWLGDRISAQPIRYEDAARRLAAAILHAECVTRTKASTCA